MKQTAEFMLSIKKTSAVRDLLSSQTMEP